MTSGQSLRTAFIGGTGSSGTVAVRRILLKHSMTYGFINEARFIVDPCGILDLIDSLSLQWSPYNAEIAIRRFENMINNCFLSGRTDKLKNLFLKLRINPPKYSYLSLCASNKIDKHYYLNALNKYLSKLRYHISDAYWYGSPPFHRKGLYEVYYLGREELIKITTVFLEELLKTLDGYSPKNVFVENTPYNILQAHRLLKLFPEMKLLHVYRDPKDVISSFKHRNYGDQDIIINATRFVNIWNRWIEVRNLLPEGRCVEFNLKDLVNHSKKMIQYICDEIGVPFEKEMMTVPLDKSHPQRWKKDIDGKVLTHVDAMLEDIYREIKRLDHKTRVNANLI